MDLSLLLIQLCFLPGECCICCLGVTVVLDTLTLLCAYIWSTLLYMLMHAYSLVYAYLSDNVYVNCILVVFILFMVFTLGVVVCDVGVMTGWCDSSLHGCSEWSCRCGDRTAGSGRPPAESAEQGMSVQSVCMLMCVHI